MKLGPNFTAHELTRSNRFPDLATPFDELKPHVAAHVQRVVTEFLQPVRDRWGRVRVLSGFRSPALNDAVGGVARSRHLRGLGCDWIPDDSGQLEVWRWIVENMALGIVSFDRLCIYTELNPITFHVDLREWDSGEPRLRLYRDSPWQRLTIDEALALAS